MNHVSETDLIRLVAGELHEARREALRRHIESCPACRQAFERQQAVAALLGAWTIEAEHPDLWPAIQRRLDSPARPDTLPLRVRIGRITRVAAAVALGVGLGYLSGRIAGDVRQRSRAAVAAVDDEEALRAIDFHVIESTSPAGLYTVVCELANEPPQTEAKS